MSVRRTSGIHHRAALALAGAILALAGCGAPGTYLWVDQIPKPMLAAAGGLTPFAGSTGIYVLRAGYFSDGNPAPARIRFRLDDLRTAHPPAAIFRMRAGDVVVVE